jgi:hypothetical protein
VTRFEAEQRARWLQQNDPARETHRFIARDDPRTGNERRVPGLPGGLG